MPFRSRVLPMRGEGDTSALGTFRKPKQRLACAPISGEWSINDPVIKVILAHFPVREQRHSSKPLHAVWPVN